MNVKLKFKTGHSSPCWQSHDICGSQSPQAEVPSGSILSRPISGMYSPSWCRSRYGKLSFAEELTMSVTVGGGLLPVPSAQEQGWMVTLGRRRGPVLWQRFLCKARKCLFAHWISGCAHAGVPVFLSKLSTASSSHFYPHPAKWPLDLWLHFHFHSIVLSLPSLPDSSHFAHPFSTHDPRRHHSLGIL